MYLPSVRIWSMRAGCRGGTRGPDCSNSRIAVSVTIMTNDVPRPLAGTILLFLILATAFIVAGCGGSTESTVVPASSDGISASAANRGDPGAMTNLGVLAYEAGDLDTARVWLEKAANRGDPNAARRLAELDASN